MRDCQYDLYNWCVSHDYDHQCCQYLPFQP